MKIKFIQDHGNKKAGDVINSPAYIAQMMIKQGVAVLHSGAVAQEAEAEQQAEVEPIAVDAVAGDAEAEAEQQAEAKPKKKRNNDKS